MPLPPHWTPLDETSRNNLDHLFNKFNEITGDMDRLEAAERKRIRQQEREAESDVNNQPKTQAAEAAKIAETRKSVDIELLRELKNTGVNDQDLILIGAAMLANK